MSDEAARRRRWRLVTLGEVLAVAAVAVSALTLWDNHRGREEELRTRQAQARAASSAAVRLTLRAAVGEEGRRLSLAAVAEGQAIQGQTITFPTAFSLAPVETTGDPRIETAWFDDTVRRARDAAGAKGEAVGDLRVPVAITTRFLADGSLHEERALYDIGYRLESGLFGSSVRMTGLSLIGRVRAGEEARRLRSLWASRGKQ